MSITRSRLGFLYLRSQAGQGLSEYIIIAIIVAILVIVALRFFGGSITNQYQTATQEIGSLDSGGATDVPSPSGQPEQPRGDSEPVPSSGGTAETRQVSGSSSRKGVQDINREVSRLRPEGVGEKTRDPVDEIEVDWKTLFGFATVAVLVGVWVVIQTSNQDKKKKKKKFSLFPKISKNSKGQAMVEFVFVLITFLFCVMGIIQLAMCLNAYALVRYAAYNAARAGIVYGGDPDKMLEAARLSLVAIFPRHGRADHVRGFVENYLAARATDHVPFLTYYPFKRGSFGTLEYITDVRIINNNGLNSGDVVTFDDPVDADRSTLTVQVEHQYELVVPLVNRIIFYAYTMWRETGSVSDETLEEMSAKTDRLRRTGKFKDIEYRIPLIATYTMRLQSDYEVR